MCSSDLKQIGVGDNAQQLISDADVIRRQEFYWREATLIINDKLKDTEDFISFIDI